MGGIDSSEASDGSHLCHFAFTALYREKMATRSPPSFGEWLWQQLSAKSTREPAGQLYRDHRGDSILATDGGGPNAAFCLPLFPFCETWERLLGLREGDLGVQRAIREDVSSL